MVRLVSFRFGVPVISNGILIEMRPIGCADISFISAAKLKCFLEKRKLLQAHCAVAFQQGSNERPVFLVIVSPVRKCCTCVATLPTCQIK